LKKISFIFLPILFFIYIAVETYLKLNHSSLCETSGCQLAGALLRFDSIYLNFIGMASAITIIVVGLLSYREIISEKLFFLVVGASLLFETIMLGYQFYASPEMCVFCMGVYAFLVAILLLASPKYFAITAIGAISVFTSLSFLEVPSAKPYLGENGNYLIQSENCGHCRKVKAYMKEHDIKFTKIDIGDIEAQNFATFLNFKTIPILLVKEGEKIRIINGDKDIINSFKTPTENIINNIGNIIMDKIEESITVGGDEEPSSTTSSTSTTTNDLFSGAGEEDEGCGFATLNKIEPDCTK
jgi:arsenate reductase-like glutaredoxin family protein